MTLYALKPRFQALLRPAAGGLTRMGVPTKPITIATTVLSVAVEAWVT